MNRLSYGIKTASNLFQLEIEKLLQGIQLIANFIDDIIITGKNDGEHLKALKEVFKR
jgi:hypothetical protein